MYGVEGGLAHLSSPEFLSTIESVRSNTAAKQGVHLTHFDPSGMKLYLQCSRTGHSLWLQWPNFQVHHCLTYVSLSMDLYRVVAYNDEGERRK